MKSLENFVDSNISKEQEAIIVGGINVTSPYPVTNVDEAMDAYWTLYDLGVNP